MRVTNLQILILAELVGMLVYGLYLINHKHIPIRRDDWIFVVSVLVVSILWFIWIPMKSFNRLMKIRKAQS